MQLFFHRIWQTRGFWAWLMLPISWLVCGLAWAKRALYEQGWLAQKAVSVPVIVVGNIAVGGSGKTPLVAYLVGLLKENGFAPGVISRGYKGEARAWPQAVSADSDPKQVGDEPVMLAVQAQCPVVAGPNRVKSARYLLDHNECDVIVSDDGFQHLSLARDIDIVVTDRQRGLGNGWCLPAGPLRESASSIKHADMRVDHVEQSLSVALNNDYLMTLKPGQVRSLDGAPAAENLDLFQAPLHAIVGIGHPARFFDSLRRLGYEIIEHAFADHHRYTPAELDFGDGNSIITTAKDAIKIADLSINVPVWVLPVSAILSANFKDDLLIKLKTINS